MAKLFISAIAIATLALVDACGATSSNSEHNQTGSTVGTSSGSGLPTSPTSDNSTIAPADLPAVIRPAMHSATSFRVFGTMTKDGEEQEVDLRFGSHKARWSITQDDKTMEMIKPGGDWAYLTANDSMWRKLAGDSVAALMSGKWLRFSVDDPSFANIANEFDKDAFVEDLMGTLTPEAFGKLTNFGPTAINGRPAIDYRNDAGESLTIAASGPPVLIQLAAGASRLTFLEYGRAFSFAAPPASKTVGRSKLGRVSAMWEQTLIT
jgi:hypothetical protein